MVHRTYGHLELAELPVPAVKDDEVLIRVKAAGVDPGAYYRMVGIPYLVRFMGFGVSRPNQPVAGGDVAGVVEKIGAKVTRLKVGDEVFGASEGSFAEFVVAKEGLLAHKPANVSWAQAAVVATSGATALRAVKAAGPGKKALVVGAAGGVGTFLVQLHEGEVTAVCSGGKADLVRRLGAAHVVDYTKDDLGTGRYDVVYDVYGGRDINVLRRRLTPNGKLILLGGKPKGKVIGIGRTLRAMLLNPFIRHQIQMLFVFPTTEEFEELGERLANGTLVPALDRTFPLSETKEAIAHVMAGRAKGKSVITL
ncbi:NAD(P)-dependent alcohol dehydrogenase [Herbidospora galbida]|uniref:NAD(P)-dependent alcohol dehydrogenase n=1 Tax=Herbidospora galbida TaxID=2575442 RepID=A0A4U3MBB8_9ACTN|nr:NAD(P)-dependent alcohol dehydrogenase [Herbidospora galbida]TKK85940.1 NAD(P)-dependent alcohol dehydrogenase [Herbidospora galbida]